MNLVVVSIVRRKTYCHEALIYRNAVLSTHSFSMLWILEFFDRNACWQGDLQSDHGERKNKTRQSRNPFLALKYSKR